VDDAEVDDLGSVVVKQKDQRTGTDVTNREPRARLLGGRLQRETYYIPE
jgi:hypothetical protein